VVKLAGGAKMFAFSSSHIGQNIGAQNAYRILDIFDAMGMAVVARDIGGTQGRTVFLDTSTGELVVRVLGSGQVVL